MVIFAFEDTQKYVKIKGEAKKSWWRVLDYYSVGYNGSFSSPGRYGTCDRSNGASHVTHTHTLDERTTHKTVMLPANVI
jgi:hypothetical protein